VKGKISYGSISISYRVVPVDRKTLEIAVHPDKAVVIKAPLGTDFSEIHKRVLRRAGWIKRQLDYFRQFDPRMPPRHYVGGETHLYLGKRYRLKIAAAERDEVKLVSGYFLIGLESWRTVDRVKMLLDRWYAEKAAINFNERFERNWRHFDRVSANKPALRVRRMHKRWGSLSKNGLLTLNTDLVRAPKQCIDYVIVHELCHLKYHDHSSAFYHLLNRAMPDWEKRKAKLEWTLVHA
jgi:predicted metal-dependent hydrolase